MSSVFPRFKTSKRPFDQVRMAGERVGTAIPRILLALFIVTMLVGAYFTSTIKRAGVIEYSLPELQAGDIAPRSEIAMIDFQVPKPSAQLQDERRRAAGNIVPVFSREQRSYISVGSEIDTLFAAVAAMPGRSAPDSVKRQIENTVAGMFSYEGLEAFRKNLLSRGTDHGDTVRTVLISALERLGGELIVSRRDDLRYYSDDHIMLEDVNGQRMMNVDTILDVSAAGDTLRQFIDTHLGDILSGRNRAGIHKIAVRYIRPNLTYNALRTGELRSQAMDAVPLHMVSYQMNERIIEANVPVSQAQVLALDAYREALESRTFSENRRKHYAMAIGKSLVACCIIGIFAGYLAVYRRKIFGSLSLLILLTIVAALPLSVAYYTAWGGELSLFIVPVAVATILATILFDAEIGILMSVGVSILTATLIDGGSMRTGILYFLAGSVGSLTVGKVRHRKEFYRSMLFVPLTMAITIAATNDWVSNTSFADVGKDMFLAAINGFFCPIIAIGLLPLLESVFKIATDITLLEMSDLNNPLLKETAVKAPGTFSSVLMVGSLAEAAAERIGANALLARVGSYYHDIGKSVIPEYFIENQYGGQNPHDRLSPHMSALVIASHVKEGYELGVKFGLPEAILNIIKQHHGTSLMASIYNKAEEQAKGEPVDESAFRYPGPKPQTREAGIVMLADLVEAASRTLHDRSPGRMKALIQAIIQKRFLEGELDECDLTLKDLHNIQETFLPVLIGSYHGRIEYPWQKEAREKADNGDKEASQDNNSERHTTAEKRR